MTGHRRWSIWQKIRDYGVERLSTLIRTRRQLTGVNIEATANLARELRIPVIASGGINSLKDIKELASFRNEGVVPGAIADARSTRAPSISGCAQGAKGK